jgi:hypothetical protein
MVTRLCRRVALSLSTTALVVAAMAATGGREATAAPQVPAGCTATATLHVNGCTYRTRTGIVQVTVSGSVWNVGYLDSSGGAVPCLFAGPGAAVTWCDAPPGSTVYGYVFAPGVVSLRDLPSPPL